MPAPPGGRTALVAALLSSAMTAAACSATAPDDCSYSCADNGGSCPSGLECVSGFCRAGGASGSCLARLDGSIEDGDGDVSQADVDAAPAQDNLLWSGGFESSGASYVDVATTIINDGHYEPSGGIATRTWYLLNPIAGQGGLSERTASASRSGSSGVRLAQNPMADQGGVAWAEQTVAVEAGARYAVRFFGRCAEPADDGIFAIAYFRTDFTTYTGSQGEARPSQAVGTAWVQMDGEMTAPGDASQLRLIVLSNGSLVNTCDADDVSVTRVESP